ncbi:MAG: hypothetical protein HOW73_43460 [Polyangiaceae bacterium]|nr:hypothetical protein [Polyangiaceae bacterium]
MSDDIRCSPGCTGPLVCAEPGCTTEHPNACAQSQSDRGWVCRDHRNARMLQPPPNVSDFTPIAQKVHARAVAELRFWTVAHDHAADVLREVASDVGSMEARAVARYDELKASRDHAERMYAQHLIELCKRAGVDPGSLENGPEQLGDAITDLRCAKARVDGAEKERDAEMARADAESRLLNQVRDALNVPEGHDRAQTGEWMLAKIKRVAKERDEALMLFETFREIRREIVAIVGEPADEKDPDQRRTQDRVADLKKDRDALQVRAEKAEDRASKAEARAHRAKALALGSCSRCGTPECLPVCSPCARTIFDVESFIRRIAVLEAGKAPTRSEPAGPDASDFDEVCEGCDQTVTEPHTWTECSKWLREMHVAGVNANVDYVRLCDAIGVALDVEDAVRVAGEIRGKAARLDALWSGQALLTWKEANDVWHADFMHRGLYIEAAHAVACEQLARVVARLDAVPIDNLVAAYERQRDGGSPRCDHASGLEAVRGTLIAAISTPAAGGEEPARGSVQVEGAANDSRTCDHKFLGPPTCAKCGVSIATLRAPNPEPSSR